MGGTNFSQFGLGAAGGHSETLNNLAVPIGGFSHIGRESGAGMNSGYAGPFGQASTMNVGYEERKGDEHYGG